MTLWVGSYAAKGGAGLYSLRAEGSGLQTGLVEDRIRNASFGIWDAASKVAYFACEEEQGRVSAWRCERDRWVAMGSCESGGSLPCYLAAHPQLPLLAVANYGDGVVALIELREGRPHALVERRRHSGRGPNAERQDGPHAHCAIFDPEGAWLYHVDLGLDRVLRYPLNDGQLGESELAYTALPGSGPRHLAFHADGRHAFLLCELSAELVLLKRVGTGFEKVQTVRTGTNPKSKGNLGGHLGFWGERVVVTNRGDDSMVVYEFRQGRLSRSGWCGTEGASPRHFAILGETLIVAHEQDELVNRLAMPAENSARPWSLGSCAIPGAAFVLDAGPGRPVELTREPVVAPSVEVMDRPTTQRRKVRRPELR